MKQVLRIGLAVSILSMALLSARAQVVPQPFSADMAVTTNKGDKMPGKFYFAPPKLRMEMSSRGHDVIIITNNATQVSEILMPQQHMYMESRPGQGANPMMPVPRVDVPVDPSNPCTAHGDTTCKNLGPETVNGRVCDHWQVTDKKGAVSNTWIDQKLHFPIKTQSADGSALEFSNVKEGSPAAALFEIPPGYNKLDMGSMGGRMPQ